MMDKEEWRTVIIDGKEHKWYSVSNYGKVASHLCPIRDKLGRICGNKYNPKYFKICDYAAEYGKTNRPRVIRINLTFPVDFYDPDSYSYFSQSEKTVRRRVSIHSIVMETFKPIHLYPPEELVNCWNDVPDEAKEWIKKTITINHINHDPTDNRLINLEYTSQRGNIHAAAKFYNKNFALVNKEDVKQNEDDKVNSVLSFI